MQSETKRAEEKEHATAYYPEQNAAVRHQLNRLRLAKRHCERRIRELGRGKNIATPLVGKSLPHVSFEQLVRNGTGLNYFMEFMESEGELVLMDFYLTVDGYRLSARERQHQQYAEFKSNPTKARQEIEHVPSCLSEKEEF